MFKKLLIANRGEIAVRIMATCREMGMRTVAVYSEADKHALHVREADEAYFIGPAPAAQSYLDIDAILETARVSRAEAIHPGYGFLSENAYFAEACERAGIVFIGPSAQAMRIMGSKISAKHLAQSVGVPTVPGYAGESQEDATLLAEAQRISFPLLIKASAGGGGKGMREVHTLDQFLDQLAGARREAKASFGDETVFLERLVLRPRHVEIQILGDNYGNVVHLGERECSIQRRHQKILEESPSVALTPALRAEMGAAAVRLAKAANYVNAGTMEFILDADKQFYFLEMNTRLQVEHPVTELVTGLDLVRQQILIATGEPLQIAQEQITPRGHAIEVRLYAEDPAHNFLPSTGTITAFQQPEGPGIRLDNGAEPGDQITQYYDPMIAKLIVYGEHRGAAIARLQHALEDCAIVGVTTNIPLLSAIVRHPAFHEGATHTGFLAEHRLLDVAHVERQLSGEALIAAALYVVERVESNHGISHANDRESNPWKVLGPWHMVGEATNITYHYHGQEECVNLLRSASDMHTWSVRIGASQQEQIQVLSIQDGQLLFKRGERQIKAMVQSQTMSTVVAIDGHTHILERRQPPDVDALAHGGGITESQKTLTAPMAGTIVKVQVREGQMVEAQQSLVILSAMKMEHAIAAPFDGKVRRVHYGEGAVVQGGAVLVEME